MSESFQLYSEWVETPPVVDGWTEEERINANKIREFTVETYPKNLKATVAIDIMNDRDSLYIWFYVVPAQEYRLQSEQWQLEGLYIDVNNDKTFDQNKDLLIRDLLNDLEHFYGPMLSVGYEPYSDSLVAVNGTSKWIGSGWAYEMKIPFELDNGYEWGSPASEISIGINWLTWETTDTYGALLPHYADNIQNIIFPVDSVEAVGENFDILRSGELLHDLPGITGDRPFLSADSSLFIPITLSTGPETHTDTIEKPTTIEKNNHESSLWGYRAKVLDQYVTYFSRPDQVSEEINTNLYLKGQSLAQELASSISQDAADQMTALAKSLEFTFNAFRDSRANWEVAIRSADKDPALISVVESLEDLRDTSKKIAEAYAVNDIQLAESLEQDIPSKTAKVSSSLDSFVEAVAGKKESHTENIVWETKAAKGGMIEKEIRLSGTVKDISFVIEQTPAPDFWTFSSGEFSANYYDADSSNEKRRPGHGFRIDGYHATTSGAAYLPFPFYEKIWLDITPKSFGSKGFLFFSSPIETADLVIDMTINYDSSSIDKDLAVSKIKEVAEAVKSALKSF